MISCAAALPAENSPFSGRAYLVKRYPDVTINGETSLAHGGFGLFSFIWPKKDNEGKLHVMVYL